MKKISTLLVAALPVMAMAQIQSALIDTEGLGITSDNAPLAAGTVLCSTENVTMSMAYEDSPKLAGIEANDCTGAWIGEEFFSASNGVQLGTANPASPGFFEAPSGGAVAQFDVTADGYLICLSKLSSNKNYWAYEGLYGWATAISYTCGILWNTELGADGTPSPYVFTLPAEEGGYVDLEAEDIAKYVKYSDAGEAQQTNQIRVILTGDPDTSLSGNGFGFIGFPVYADAENYLLCAQGSKISLNGFIFIPAEAGATPESACPASIWAGTDSEKLYEFKLDGSGAGISSVVADKAIDENAPIYNVMGQKVSADTKGILIQNGQKFYNK